MVYELMNKLRAKSARFEHWTWDSHTSKSTELVPNMVGFQRLCDFSLDDPRLSLFFDIELRNLSIIRSMDTNADYNFDIVHVHTWELALSAIIAKYVRKTPFVYTAHDVMQSDAHHELNETVDIYKHGVLNEKIILSEASRIVTISEDNTNFLLKFYPDYVDKIETIPNGVDTERFHPGAALDQRFGLEPGYLFFLGRAVPSKGIEAILEMLRRIPKWIPMVFALSTKRWDGEKHPRADEYVGRIRECIRERPATHLIIDEWDRDRISGLYANALITLAPSTYEPGGMVALESQSCATPVITNDIGFMKISVDHGVNGLILGPGPNDPNYIESMAEAVISLVRNPQKARRLGENGRGNAVSNHSWEKRAQQHLELYERVLSEEAS